MPAKPLNTKMDENLNANFPADRLPLQQHIDFSQECVPFNRVVRGEVEAGTSQPIQRRLRIEFNNREPLDLKQEEGNKETIINLRTRILDMVRYQYPNVDRTEALRVILELVREGEHIHTLESLRDHILMRQGLIAQPELGIREKEGARLEQRLAEQVGWNAAEREPVFVVRTHNGPGGEILYNWNEEYSAGIPTVRVEDIDTNSGNYEAVERAMARVGGLTVHKNCNYYVYAIWPGDPVRYRDKRDRRGNERLVLGSLMRQRCVDVGRRPTGRRIGEAVISLTEEYKRHLDAQKNKKS